MVMKNVFQHNSALLPAQRVAQRVTAMSLNREALISKQRLACDVRVRFKAWVIGPPPRSPKHDLLLPETAKGRASAVLV
jgi:hypothetical protein